MKKSAFYVGMMLAMSLASCTSDLPVGNNGGVVTFNVQLPKEIGTRAQFGDGLQAEKLNYAVYDENGTFILEGSKDFGGSNSTTVTLSLANGMSYKIAFFASEGGDENSAPYTFDAENKTITANYANMASNYNTSDHDAFFKLEEITVTEAASHDVVLKRPVAQINWGTDDLGNPSVTNAYGSDLSDLTSKVTVKGAYTTLNMLTGEYSGETDTEVTFEAMAIPQSKGAGVTTPDFPVTGGYEYVSIQYILVPSDKSSVVDLEWTPYCKGTEKPNVTVASAPVQANYRTNIFGSLLTSNIDFNVTKDVIFDTPSYDIKWNGEIDTNLPTDEDSKTITISNAAQLAGFAQLVNEGNSYRYYTINLTADIDLNNEMWTPIGLCGASSTKFAGVFDGNNYTISNLNVVAPAPLKAGDETAGLFGGAELQVGTDERCVIKNLTVDNATVRSNHYAGAIVGWTNSGVDITNCHVKNSTITSTYKDEEESGDKAGGIVGYFYGGIMDGCSVSNSTITAARDLGGLAGMLQVNTSNESSTVTVKNSSVTDTEIIATTFIETIGEIAGRRASSTTRVIESGNTIERVTLRVPIVDGLERVNDSYNISKPAGLVKVSEMMMNTEDDLKGKSVNLTSDIDATGISTSAVWNNLKLNDFTFDGGGYTIKNLTMTDGYFPGGSHNGLTIKNITFENCKVTKGTAKGVNGTGVVLSQIYGDFTMENVHVKNCSVEGTFAVGGLIGQYTNEGSRNYPDGYNRTATLTNCSVTGTKITALGNSQSAWIEAEGVAGANAFIGASICWYQEANTNTINLTNCTASGNTITNDESVKGGGLYGYSLMIDGKLSETVITE